MTLEEELFGTADPDGVAACVDRFCARALGSPVERREFSASSVMSVHGVRLLDGRHVVVKVGRRSLHATYLSTVQVVQARLYAQGLPCPRPALGPTALEAGIAIVEELLDPGQRASAHDAPIRAAMARGLARIVEACRESSDLPGLGPSHFASPAPRAAGGRSRTTGASTSPARRTEPRGSTRLPPARVRGSPPVAVNSMLGHCDWRAEHVRFAGEEIVATYDWRSPRPASLSWSARRPMPSPPTGAYGRPAGSPRWTRLSAIVADYEAARGAGFSQAEREALDAAWVYATAYGARCEHSDARLGLWRPDDEDSYGNLLARHGEPLLG